MFRSEKAGSLRTAGLVFVSCVWAVAFGAGSLADWKRSSLLDPGTQARLKSYDDFFYEVFQYPENYKNASAAEKKKLEKQWMTELGGKDFEKAAAAAAYLGMVKSKDAARVLQKILADPPKNGRLRWVCTRSLGQIGAQSSVPTLIALLDNTNHNTQIYALAGLVEITGVYPGGNKADWQKFLQESSSTKDADPNLAAEPAEASVTSEPNDIQPSAQDDTTSPAGYILYFTAKGDFKVESKNELLDEFNLCVPGSMKTSYFRTKETGDKIIASLFTKTKEDAQQIALKLKGSTKLKLIKIQPVSNSEFENYKNS